MSKKRKKHSRKSSSPPAIPVQRLQAIQRRMARGDFEQARQLIDTALRSAPRYGPLFQLRIEALLELEREAAAELTAYHWTRARPRSGQAWFTLSMISEQTGRGALALDAARQFERLDSREQTGLKAPIDTSSEISVISPYTGKPVDEKDVATGELGQLCIECREFETAIEVLGDCTDVPARNNLGISLFQLGRIDAALQCFSDNWESEPKNLISLGWLVRLHLFLGNEERAHGLTIPLLHTLPVRGEDAAAQISGLLLLGKEQEALTAFATAQQQSWWKQISRQEPTLALPLHMGAVCHARTGNPTKAKSLWKKAIKLQPYIPFFEDNLNDLALPANERNGAYPLPLNEYFPLRWLDQLSKGSPGKKTLNIFSSVSNRYLLAVAHIGDIHALTIAEALLIHRIGPGNKQSKQDLLALIRGRQGSYSHRFSVATRLIEQHIIDKKEITTLWDGESYSEVRLMSHRISNEPKESKLSDAQNDRFGEALDAIRRRDLERGKQILKQLAVETPDEPALWGNLATVYQYQGDWARADELLEHAVEIDPDYIIGRCNLALLKVDKGQKEAAEKLLDGLLDCQDLHIQEAISLYGTHAVIAAKAGNFREANKLLGFMEQPARNYHETSRLEDYRTLVKQIKNPWTSIFSKTY